MKSVRDIAIDGYEMLLRYDTEAMREIVTDMMRIWGDLDVWLDVFRNDKDMLRRFEEAKYRILISEPLIVDYIEGR